MTRKIFVADKPVFIIDCPHCGGAHICSGPPDPPLIATPDFLRGFLIGRRVTAIYPRIGFIEVEANGERFTLLSPPQEQLQESYDLLKKAFDQNL